jgi:hypothetical protein
VTEPQPPGGSSPLRIGGFVLLGIAAVAAVGGLVSLAGGGGAAPPVASHASTAAVPPSAGPPLADGAKPSPSAPTSPRPSAPPPVPAPPKPNAPRPLPGAGLPPVSSGSGAGKGYGPVAVKAPIRVYNNSLIKDLAERAASDFQDDGWDVTSVGNYPYGIIPTSTVYYRPGTREQAAAEYLASSFGIHAEPRFVGLRDASPGLIVILTKDYQRR